MLKYFLAIVAVLLLAATVLWGFPGVWALLMIVPGFILGATIAHVRRPREGESGAAPIRPAVIVLGGLFGLGTAGASLMFAWAAAQPPTIVVEASLVIEAPSERIWAEVHDPYRRTRWDQWVVDLEPTGKAKTPAIGSEYRTELRLERMEVPAIQTVTALEEGRAITWAIHPVGGSRLENMSESVTLEPQGADKTLVRYRIAYDVPSVFGRVAERIGARGGVERMTTETLARLGHVATGLVE
ncbi:MAG: SRPBCC family protein [Deltaproteobacteria bacterium]|nr:SRPBCC family protein [Deltaproteobacteria bacterium]